jgi:ABC-type cobalamin/Fe3+-siderophores transport system ATPase subunit
LAVADQALLMFGEHDFSCGLADEVLTEENLHRLYGVALRRVNFDYQDENLVTLAPVYPGLRREVGHLKKQSAVEISNL